MHPPLAIRGSTVDDVMLEAVEKLLELGHPVASTEGANTELLGVTLNLTNPRARLSRTEARGKPFSCLGELCWYLAGSSATEQIVYYLSHYNRYDEHGQIFGAYGPRLLRSFGTNQLDNVVRQLRERPNTRQAVIQLFGAMDLSDSQPPVPEGKKRDIPCTCTLQFLVRESALHMITYMRSNDVWFGLTHDLFCFTMIQEIVARSIEQKVGTYCHTAGSLHLYERHRLRAQRLTDEGWQSTTQVMPPMPSGDPMPSLTRLLSAEKYIRVAGVVPDDIVDGLDAYWVDLIRLLQAYRFRRDHNADAIERVRLSMASRVYDIYLREAARAAGAAA